MLRRAENVRTAHKPSFWTGKGPTVVTVGRSSYVVGKYSKQDYADRSVKQLKHPILLAKIGDRRYWQFQNRYFWENDGLNSHEVYALLMTRDQRQRQQIERAQATVAMGSAPRTATARRSIPDDLKQYIWTRDEGRCRSCGATTELQFDHIIPVAKGGSNNSENLQILCGPCNRSKSDGLTTRR